MRRFIIKNGSQVNISSFIRQGVVSGQLSSTREIVKEGLKLDFYADKYYGDSSLWWIIAAASGIGWWLQVPPGIVLYIPNSISDIEDLKKRI